MPVRCKETRQFMMVSTRMGVLCLVTCLVSDPTVYVLPSRSREIRVSKGIKTGSKRRPSNAHVRCGFEFQLSLSVLYWISRSRARIVTVNRTLITVLVLQDILLLFYLYSFLASPLRITRRLYFIIFTLLGAAPTPTHHYGFSPHHHPEVIRYSRFHRTSPLLTTFHWSCCRDSPRSRPRLGPTQCREHSGGADPVQRGSSVLPDPVV